MTAPASCAPSTSDAAATEVEGLVSALYSCGRQPGRLGALATGLVLASLAAAAWAFAGNLLNGAPVAALCACACIALLSVWEFRRSAHRYQSSGTLRIAADGRARWEAHPPGQERKPLRLPTTQNGIPFEPETWIHAFGITWIAGRAGAEAVRLAFARDGLSEADWNGLRCWMRWLDRGGGLGRPR